MTKYNYMLSVICMLIGIGGIYFALGFESRGGNPGDPGAAFWPIILNSGLIIAAIALFIQSLIKSAKNKLKEKPLIDYRSRGMRCVFELFGIVVLYAVLMKPCGFFVASAVFIILTMLSLGVRRPIVIVLTTIGICAFIYVVFPVLMGVVLPKFALF